MDDELAQTAWRHLCFFLTYLGRIQKRPNKKQREILTLPKQSIASSLFTSRHLSHRSSWERSTQPWVTHPSLGPAGAPGTHPAPVSHLEPTQHNVAITLRSKERQVSSPAFYFEPNTPWANPKAMMILWPFLPTMCMTPISHTHSRA